MKTRLFSKSDLWLSALCGFLSFVVYAWTTAPNVTLGDSGEFLTAAAHFGVPHPTGYPLWTFSAWVFQLLVPLGNIAWQVNLFSGFCGALTVALSCALTASTARWIFGDHKIWIGVSSVSTALLLAFSVSIWSQATITEVYTMHSLLTALYFVSLYALIRKPSSKLILLTTFFLISLSFAHHQLTLPLAPLPLLIVILLRRRIFWDLFMAGTLTLLLGYLCFAILSKNPEVLKTAIRFFYCVAAGFVIFVWLRRGLVRWWLIAFLPVAVGAGMLPYLYLPLASRTNPPMNWGYARDLDGVFYSFNRSQYAGSLSDLTLSSLGKLMGVSSVETNAARTSGERPTDIPRLDAAKLSVQFYWQKLEESFTILSVIFYLVSVLFVLRLPLPARTWIYLLHLGFVLSAFLLMLMNGYKTDKAAWDLQMPWHAYDYFIFSLLCGVGAAGSLIGLASRFPRLSWLGYALLILPISTFCSNYNECSQRNHWFGWMFGHDILADLPPGSIMIGGSDPGRFVPTYMIFGESPQPASSKKDPQFDRRDLYIITQNALGETHYMNYLRDQYTIHRPKPNAFERWLGRDKAYPEAPLTLPTGEESDKLIKEEAVKKAQTGQSFEQDESIFAFSVVLHWIWEKNRDKHDFFIEESFPIEWTYDYAIPHGLVYKLNKSKVDHLSAEDVQRDFAFWKEYKQRLLSDPGFANDYDAQRAFSKLRSTIGNIYAYRKMYPEAIAAYRDALDLSSGNAEALVRLIGILWDQNEPDEVIRIVSRAYEDDPNNIGLLRILYTAKERKKIGGQILEQEAKLAQHPKSGETLRKLIELYASIGETNKPRPLLDRIIKDFPNDADMMRYVISYYSQFGDLGKTLAPSKQLTEIEGSNAENFLLLARAYFINNQKKEFFENAAKAIQLGGLPARETLLADPLLAPLKSDPEFQKILDQGMVSPK